MLDLRRHSMKARRGGCCSSPTTKGSAGVYFKRPETLSAKTSATGRRDARHAVLRQAKRELAEYFAGERKRFEVALAPEGTPFQRSVWKAIAKVGFGETISYGELARARGTSGQRARRGRGDRPQPDRHHRALPPHRRRGRQPDRLRRRPRRASARCSRSKQGLLNWF